MLLGVSILLFLAVILLGWSSIHSHALKAFDESALHAIVSRKSEIGTSVALLFSFIGDRPVVPLEILIVGLLLYRHHSRISGLLFSSGMLVVGASEVVLKAVFAKTPPLPGFTVVSPWDYSYPSGHAAMTTFLLGFLALLGLTKLKRHATRTALIATSALLIAGVCWSRVYLLAHWPSDVVGGFLFGSGWVLLATYVLKKQSSIS